MRPNLFSVMSNNDILKSLRYTLNVSDPQMLEMFNSVGIEVATSELTDWFRKEDDILYRPIYDIKLAAFLNATIVLKRGKKEGVEIINEKKLNNNLILRKLRIAFNLKDDEMLEILKLVDFEISKHELSAFFRKPGQNQYRVCKDQILRKFIMGLQKKYRP